MKLLLLCLLALQAAALVQGYGGREGGGIQREKITTEVKVCHDISVLTTEEFLYGYANVRCGIHLYYELHVSHKDPHFKELPFVIFLEGGPGLTGSGHANKLQVGPYDDIGQERLTSWVRSSHVLFIDSPAKSGYSFVTDADAFTVENEEVAEDLFQLIQLLLKKNNHLRKLQARPLHIAGQGYGAKIATILMHKLNQAVKSHTLKANLQSVILISPVISPLFHIESYAPFLSRVGWLNVEDKKDIDRLANNSIQDAYNGAYVDSAAQLEKLRSKLTILSHGKLNWHDYYTQLISPTEGPFYGAYLQSQMNKNKEFLELDTPNSWHAFGGKKMIDFHQPVLNQNTTEYLEDLLNDPYIHVHIIHGALDVYANTLGLLDYIESLYWNYKDAYEKAYTHQLVNPKEGYVEGFVKECSGLHLYTVSKAGHYVIQDQQLLTYALFLRIIGIENTKLKFTADISV